MLVVVYDGSPCKTLGIYGYNMVAFWIASTWFVSKPGHISWIVTSSPLISILPLGLILLNASAIGTFGPGTY